MSDTDKKLLLFTMHDKIYVVSVIPPGYMGNITPIYLEQASFGYEPDAIRYAEAKEKEYYGK